VRRQAAGRHKKSSTNSELSKQNGLLHASAWRHTQTPRNASSVREELLVQAHEHILVREHGLEDSVLLGLWLVHGEVSASHELLPCLVDALKKKLLQLALARIARSPSSLQHSDVLLLFGDRLLQVLDRPDIPRLGLVAQHTSDCTAAQRNR